MDRVKPDGYSALIEAAYQHIPPGLHRLIRPHFLCATDPLLAGLHLFEDAIYGQSYRDVAHCVYEFHQFSLSRARRHVTVVLPYRRYVFKPSVVVHELGHVLHDALDFDHDALPVTMYANTTRFEAFAEAFAAWVMPFGHGYGAAKDRLYDHDRATVALFEELAAW